MMNQSDENNTSQEPESKLKTRTSRGSIRTRLLYAFIGLVVVSAGTITTFSSVLGARDAEEQIVAQLESVTTLKEAEIQTWMESMQDDLIFILSNRDFLLDTREYLERAPDDLSLQSKIRSMLRNWHKEYDDLFILNEKGEVVISTGLEVGDRYFDEGDNFFKEYFFQGGLQGPLVTIKPNFPLPEDMSVVVVRPIPNLSGKRIGVLVGYDKLDILNSIMRERAGLGETGETYLISQDQLLLTESRFEGYFPGKTYFETEGVEEARATMENGYGSYIGYRGVETIGVYHWLPDLRAVLMAEQEQSEAMSATFATLRLNLAVSAVSILLAIWAGLVITRGISNPLTQLTELVEKITGGNLTLQVPEGRKDEIGRLGSAFNSMTDQLRTLLEGLETQVSDRTQDLERRAVQLQTAAEVARDASQAQDLDTLLNNAVRLIADRFGFYHAGIFLLDDLGEFAVLQAASSEGGQRMLARQHKLQVGETGIVGFVTDQGEPRIALDVGADATFFDNPDMPDTRSEMALPLMVRAEIIGALDVQSIEAGAFDDEDVAILQILADQLALAIYNTRLIQQVQESLDATQKAYGDISRQAWQNLLDTQDFNERYDPQGVMQLENQDLPTLSIPISIRGQIIGVIKACKNDKKDTWSQDEVDLMETITEQISLALESARLFSDTRRRAERDQLTQQLSDRIHRASDIDLLMQTVIQDVASALGATGAFVQFGTLPEDNGNTIIPDADSTADVTDKEEIKS